MNKMLIAAASLLAGFGAKGLADPSEPPLQVVLTIDGVQQKLTTGEKASVNIAGKPRDVLVEVAPTRRLDAEGVAFDYPSSMGFEFEHDEEIVDTLLSLAQPSELVVSEAASSERDRQKEKRRGQNHSTVAHEKESTASVGPSPD